METMLRVAASIGLSMELAAAERATASMSSLGRFTLFLSALDLKTNLQAQRALGRAGAEHAAARA